MLSNCTKYEKNTSSRALSADASHIAATDRRRADEPHTDHTQHPHRTDRAVPPHTPHRTQRGHSRARPSSIAVRSGGGGIKLQRSTAIYKSYQRRTCLGPGCLGILTEDFDVEQGGSRAVPSVCVNPRSSDQPLPCADAVCLHAPQYSFPRTGPALALARDLRSRGSRLCGVN